MHWPTWLRAVMWAFDHRGRGLWRRLLHHARAQPRFCDEVANLDAGPTSESAQYCGCGQKGFELSEASNTPVMLQLRIRACHVHGHFVAGQNKRAEFTLKQALENPQRDVSRIVLPPASFVHEQEKIKERWPAAVRYIEDNKLNEFFAEGADDIGIIVQGGCYNTQLRALERLGLADVYGLYPKCRCM